MHAVRKLSAFASPAGYVAGKLGIGTGSALRRISDPVSIAGQNIANGGAINAKSILDPGQGYLKTPPAAAVLPGPVTIDDATQRQAGNDRLRRRRGVLANIYSSSGGSTSVGRATLLGGG